MLQVPRIDRSAGSIILLAYSASLVGLLGMLLTIWGITYDKLSDQGLTGSTAFCLLCSLLTEIIIYRWQRIEVNGRLIKETQTKRVKSLGCEVRIRRISLA